VKVGESSRPGIVGLDVNINLKYFFFFGTTAW
jgi:hypothetical protein